MTRAVYRSEARTFVLETVPVPILKEGDALVAPRFVGICGTDLRSASADWPETPTVTQGHEVAGVVLKGPDELVGKSVVIGPRMPCGECWQCTHGLRTQCLNATVLTGNVPGGFAQYLTFPASQLVVVPDHLSLETAVLAEPLACVVRALHKIPRPLPAIANGLVLGGGPIGALFAYVLEREYGVPVAVAEPNEHRRSYLSSRIRGHVFAPDPEADDLFGVVVDTTGFLWDTAVRSVLPGGVIVCFGLSEQSGRAAQSAFTRKEVVAVGSMSSSIADLTEAIDLLARGRIRGDDLVTGIYPLEDIDSAFDEARSGLGMKVVIEPNSAREIADAPSTHVSTKG